MHMPSIRSSWLLIPAVLLILAGCKKKEEKAASQPAPDLAKQTQSYVTNRDTVVKSGPGPRFKSLSRVKRDTKIDIVGREGDWLLVVSKRGNPPGYIDARDADPAVAEAKQPGSEAQGQYVIVNDTEVRKGPGLEYGTVAKASKGMKINVVGIERGWLKVESRSGRPPGYVDPTYARRNTDK